MLWIFDANSLKKDEWHAYCFSMTHLQGFLLTFKNGTIATTPAAGPSEDGNT